MSFEYYYINSKDRASGDQDQFSVILNGVTDVHAYSIEHLMLPFTWYPIRTGVNDQIGFRIGATDYLATLAQGYYANPTDLCTEIKTKMDAIATATFTVTYSALTGKITILRAAGNFTLYNDHTNSLSGNTCYRELGFNQGTSSGTNTYTSDKVINISGFDYVNIYCGELMKFNTKIYSTDTTDSGILAKVFLDKAWGNTLYHTPPLNIIHDLDFSFYNSYVTFSILDQFGRDLNIKSDWMIKLKLYKTKDFINL